MNGPDPILSSIATVFHRFNIEKSRGGYNLLPRPGATAIARLRPIPDSDRFELFYWAHDRDRWRTFGNFGRLSLTLERALEMVDGDPIFHITRR